MFKNIIRIDSRFATFVVAIVAAIAIGPVAKGATPPSTATAKPNNWPRLGKWCRTC